MKLLQIVNGSPAGLPFKPFKQNLWDAVIGGVTSVGSSLLNFFGNRETNASNRAINEETRQWQSDENRLAYERQKELWNMENQYNSPKAQMERYREAGINPFLVGGSSLPQGASPLPSMSMSGSPSAIPMQSPKFDLSQLSDQVFRSGLLRAESANQTAQSMSEFMRAYGDVYDKAGKDAANEFANNFLPFLQGNISDVTYFHRRLEADVKQREALASSQDTEAKLLAKYGDNLNYEKLHKLREESTNLIHQRGVLTALGNLYNSAENKSNAEIHRIIEGEIPNLIAAADEKLSHSKLMKTLNLSEEDRRQFLFDTLQLQFGQLAMEYLSNYADFEENEYLRRFKGSHLGKVTKAANYTTENNPVLNIYDRVVGSAARTLNVLSPLKSSVDEVQQPSMPWQTKYRKVEHTKPTYSGKVTNTYYMPIE